MRPLRIAMLLGAVIVATPQLAAAQNDDPRLTANPTLPVPDQLQLTRMIWSTMAAIHHANVSGNYSVLRDIGAPGFQVQNSAAQLAEVFRGIREQRIDLSNTLLLGPTFTAQPTMVSNDVLRLQGLFGLRPVAVQFDLFYQWSNGDWRLYGVSLQPIEMTTVQPEGAR